MKKVSDFITKIVGNIVLLFIIVVCVVPFVYMLFMSLKSTLNKYDITFTNFTLEHYQLIMSSDRFLGYFFNSVIVAVAGVILTIIVSCMAGYAFAKLDFKGNNKIFFMIIVTMIVPSEVIIVPLYLIIKEFSWLNTYKALILPLPGAFGVFIMRQAILAIPEELLDSARIDGCRDLKILWKIVVPLVRSSILTLAIFTFIGAWNNFLWPLVVSTKDSMKTLPLGLSSLQPQYNTDVGLVMACATVSFIPPFLFYVLMQNKFKEGVALSGMKG